MIPIVKDTKILSQKSNFIHDSRLAQKICKQLEQVIDLSHQDNNPYHPDSAIGLAAIQLNFPYRVFAIKPRGVKIPFFACNPLIVRKEQPYETEETCMSLEGSRKVTRYKEITLFYSQPDDLVKVRERTFKNLWAQVIQHEMDHFEGILI